MSEQINICTTKEFKEKVVIAAKKERRSLSNFTKIALEKQIEGK